jgi:hypothetical protein
MQNSPYGPKDLRRVSFKRLPKAIREAGISMIERKLATANPIERGKYRSEARATVTMAELERWVPACQPSSVEGHDVSFRTSLRQKKTSARKTHTCIGLFSSLGCGRIAYEHQF